jgi:hypothetical protein
MVGEFERTTGVKWEQDLEFASINVEGMNETDVRETIVRPFIHALGYAYGTPNHIRTEYPLRYGKTFLGRKNPSKDPDLRGRADYICEVISHGRWVVEVKGQDKPLGIDDAEQAHTYAAHPEVAAFYYLLTNGREFRLYRTSHPAEPVLAWDLAKTTETFPIIRNIIGPAAIKRRAQIDQVDTNVPLAEGVKSRVRIVGGYLTYSEHHSSKPEVDAALARVSGMRASIIGREVRRTEWGLLRAEIELVRANDILDQLNHAAGFESFVFECADEFVSVDRERPSIFQSITGGQVHAGTVIGGVPGVPTFSLPFGLDVLAYTEAVGFVEDDKFKGTFNIAYDFRVRDAGGLPALARQVAAVFEGNTLTTVGDFEVVFV